MFHSNSYKTDFGGLCNFWTMYVGNTISRTKIAVLHSINLICNITRKFNIATNKFHHWEERQKVSNTPYCSGLCPRILRTLSLYHQICWKLKEKNFQYGSHVIGYYIRLWRTHFLNCVPLAFPYVASTKGLFTHTDNTSEASSFIRGVQQK